MKRKVMMDVLTREDLERIHEMLAELYEMKKRKSVEINRKDTELYYKIMGMVSREKFQVH